MNINYKWRIVKRQTSRMMENLSVNSFNTFCTFSPSTCIPKWWLDIKCLKNRVEALIGWWARNFLSDGRWRWVCKMRRMNMTSVHRMNCLKMYPMTNDRSPQHQSIQCLRYECRGITVCRKTTRSNVPKKLYTSTYHWKESVQEQKNPELRWHKEHCDDEIHLGTLFIG